MTACNHTGCCNQSTLPPRWKLLLKVASTNQYHRTHLADKPVGGDGLSEGVDLVRTHTQRSGNAQGGLGIKEHMPAIARGVLGHLVEAVDDSRPGKEGIGDLPA